MRDMGEEEDSTHIVPESPLIPRFGMGIELIGKQNKEWDWDASKTIEELKKQVWLGGPLVVVSLLQYSLQMISVMFIGHLGELSLSSASMAISFAEVTGFSFLLGMGSALETFCGQAYGARQHHMLGVHMQRAMLVLLLMGIPIAFIWAFTGYVFTLCGQDLEISTQAKIFARWLTPSIFPYGLLQCQLGFLQTQNNVKPLIISTVFTTLFHVLVCWTLVFIIGLGHKGAALSIAISYWANVLILAIYIYFSPACQETWTGFSKEGAKDLVSFLSVAIPSALMVCLEGWSYEFLVLMSGLLPNPKLEASVMAISLDTSALIFRIPIGFGSTVSTRVSNELGAGQPHAARLAVKVVIFLAVTEGFLVSLISIAVRDKWGYFYTNEEQVVKFMASIMPLLAVSNFMDGIQAVLSVESRYRNRMWMAEAWCICEFRSLLPYWPPFRNHLNFCLPLWSKGPLDGNHDWEWSTSNTVFSYYDAHRLGAPSREGQGQSVCILHPSNMKLLSSANLLHVKTPLKNLL